jgi:hypothetical protein
VTTHVFQKPGDYIVRVERANRLGQKAIAHLLVSSPRMAMVRFGASCWDRLRPKCCMTLTARC